MDHSQQQVISSSTMDHANLVNSILPINLMKKENGHQPMAWDNCSSDEDMDPCSPMCLENGTDTSSPVDSPRPSVVKNHHFSNSSSVLSVPLDSQSPCPPNHSYSPTLLSSPSQSPIPSKFGDNNGRGGNHATSSSPSRSSERSSLNGADSLSVISTTTCEDSSPSSERRHSAGSEEGSSTRQQLLSGPCPVCGDRVSGFHYGIFSCESCKGFFKRTVQNKKHYVCLRGTHCLITTSTRKKCPACRYHKCLSTGMKLEAIREDRTRGGRSTYHCPYSLPTSDSKSDSLRPPLTPFDSSSSEDPSEIIPPLIQDILSVEHLWHTSTTSEINRDRPSSTEADVLGNLCTIADHRLYKIVKWCKSLPLFRDIQIDDQIALLINSWCELLLLSCCYRSMAAAPTELRVSQDRTVSLEQAQALGLSPVIERMLNLTEHLRRLQLDHQEYVCLKVIILLTSDASSLKEPYKVERCQKQVIESLQYYTRCRYPQHPSKFGELLLRIPELERACQVGKDSLASKQKDGPSFNLLMELLRGDH